MGSATRYWLCVVVTVGGFALAAERCVGDLQLVLYGGSEAYVAWACAYRIAAEPRYEGLCLGIRCAAPRFATGMSMFGVVDAKGCLLVRVPPPCDHGLLCSCVDNLVA